MKKGKPIVGAEARAISREHMRKMRKIAKAKGKNVAAGLYGSLWCPICKQYTGQHRYITPAGSERWRCITGDHTFSRGRHGWLDKFTIKKKKR